MSWNVDETPYPGPDEGELVELFPLSPYSVNIPPGHGPTTLALHISLEQWIALSADQEVYIRHADMGNDRTYLIRCCVKQIYNRDNKEFKVLLEVK